MKKTLGNVNGNDAEWGEVGSNGEIGCVRV
jgi:hypothetical protein